MTDIGCLCGRKLGDNEHSCAHELRARVDQLEAERQAVLDVVNLYGDEVLHGALDGIGWPEMST